MKNILPIILIAASNSLIAQDGLMNILKDNKSDSAKKAFVFTPVINLEASTVKDQASSGTCWSYATNSFLESEMIRMGKKPVDIAEIYTARNSYIEKAINYVRMHGAITWGDGGCAHDVINMYTKYGALPQEVYQGLNYGTNRNKFAEMQGILKVMLDVVVKNPNGEISPVWLKAFTRVLDAYLGEVPETFTYNQKTYTPQSFAKEVVGINPNDYIEISSFSTSPYYQKTLLMVPDNWSLDQVYNVKLEDVTTIIDNALRNGYTVAWGTDVSEKGFSYKNGVAYIPTKKFEDMSDEEKKNMFNGPKPEPEITEQLRQVAFDNYTTTDDHSMHITGMVKDQNGKEYYTVKNSWGAKNDYKGYIYVTKNFVRYKTTAFMVHKNALPDEIKKKLGV